MHSLQPSLGLHRWKQRFTVEPVVSRMEPQYFSVMLGQVSSLIGVAGLSGVQLWVQTPVDGPVSKQLVPPPQLALFWQTLPMLPENDLHTVPVSGGCV